MDQLNYAIWNYLQSILNALIEVKRIIPPESKIIVPLTTSKAATSAFSCFIHFLFIPINDIENKYMAPNILAESTIELDMRSSGALWLCFQSAADDDSIALDNTAAELMVWHRLRVHCKVDGYVLLFVT